MDKAQERTVKHQKVAEYLTAHKLDGVVLAKRWNFSWYTCGGHNHVALATENGAAWLLVTREGARLVTTNIEATRHRGEEFPGGQMEVLEFPYHDPPQAAGVFRRLAGGLKLAADAPVPGLDLPALTGEFDRLRWRLTESEMQRYRLLATDTVAALEKAAHAARPGQTENELAGAVAAELYGRNCNFWAIFVGADDRILKYRHPLPTATKVRKYFMLIACAERDGLILSSTRLASFAPLGEELAARHEAVAMVDAALIGATRPGAKLRDIYRQGQDAYAAAKVPDEWRLHHQGGPCGYQARDVIANPTVEAEALADQAFAWNPSITGTKSEDTILCRQTGPEIMGMSDDWPVIQAEWKGQTFPRGQILVL